MKKAILIILTILIFNCIYSLPKQIESEKTFYPANIYITAIGIGDSYENARIEAQKAIASQIEVKIESTISSTQQSIEENDREYYSSVFVSKTKIIVDEMKLRGVQIVREAAEGDKYYALAVLDKDIYTNSLKAELDYYYDKLSVLVNDSKAFLERGNIKTALENLVDAMSIVEEFYPRMVLYNTISIESYKVSGDISINKVLSHIRAILTGIRLKIVSGNDQSNPAGQLLPEPLVVKVICDMRGTEIPLPDMPVIAKYANKEKLGNYTSDEHGLVTIFAESVPTDGDRGRISVYLNLYGLPPILKENLRKTEVEFRYTISEPKMSLTFAVDIKDERGRALKKVEGKIERAIKKMGYNIAEKDNAMLILEGVVRKGEVKEVDDFAGSGTQYLVTSDLDLSLKETVTDKIIGNLTATGKGLDKRSEKNALEKSYNKIKISERDFSGMIGEAEPELHKIFVGISKGHLENGIALYNSSRYKDALVELSRVTAGEEQIKKAETYITKSKEAIKAEQERRRQFVLEQQKIKAEKEIELARQAANKARAEARKKEAEARISEAKATLAKIQAEIKKIEREQNIEPEKSIAKSDENEVKKNQIAYAGKIGKKLLAGLKYSEELKSQPLTAEEEKLAHTWISIGLMDKSSRDVSFDGAGKVLHLRSDHTYSFPNCSGVWEVKDGILYLDKFEIPYGISGHALMLGFKVDNKTYFAIFEKR